MWVHCFNAQQVMKIDEDTLKYKVPVLLFYNNILQRALRAIRFYIPSRDSNYAEVEASRLLQGAVRRGGKLRPKCLPVVKDSTPNSVHTGEEHKQATLYSLY